MAAQDRLNGKCTHGFEEIVISGRIEFGSQIHLFQHLYLTRSPFVLYVHSTRLGLRAQGVIPTTEHRGILQWQMDTTASQRMDTTLLTYAVSLQ